METRNSTPLARKLVRKAATGTAFAVVLILPLMWLAGAFHRKIDQTGEAWVEVIHPGRPIGNASLVTVRSLRIPHKEASVGTIKAMHETTVALTVQAGASERRVPLAACPPESSRFRAT